jgi:hypothetical protein
MALVATRKRKSPSDAVGSDVTEKKVSADDTSEPGVPKKLRCDISIAPPTSGDISIAPPTSVRAKGFPITRRPLPLLAGILSPSTTSPPLFKPKKERTKTSSTVSDDGSTVSNDDPGDVSIVYKHAHVRNGDIGIPPTRHDIGAPNIAPYKRGTLSRITNGSVGMGMFSVINKGGGGGGEYGGDVGGGEYDGGGGGGGGGDCGGGSNDLTNKQLQSKRKDIRMKNDVEDDENDGNGDVDRPSSTRSRQTANRKTRLARDERRSRSYRSVGTCHNDDDDDDDCDGNDDDTDMLPKKLHRAKRLSKQGSASPEEVDASASPEEVDASASPEEVDASNLSTRACGMKREAKKDGVVNDEFLRRNRENGDMQRGVSTNRPDVADVKRKAEPKERRVDEPMDPNGMWRGSEEATARGVKSSIEDRYDEFAVLLSNAMGTPVELGDLVCGYVGEQHLTLEQRRIMERVIAGENVFFTGKAGTGKSYLVMHIIAALEQTSRSYLVSATTGIAAAHIHGNTLHSVFGLGMRPISGKVLATKIEQNPLIYEDLMDARVLIVDETSMLAGNTFEAMEEAMRIIRKNELPFGGLQLLLIGDFGQLGAIWTRETAKYFGPLVLLQRSRAFWRCFKPRNIMQLTRVQRQKEPELLNLLTKARYGQMGAPEFALLDKLKRALPLLHGVIPTRLTSRRIDVDKQNAAALRQLPGDIVRFPALDAVLTPASAGRLQSLNAIELLELKVGAQVICTKNLPDYGIFNGSRGVVTGFTVGPNPAPIVRYLDIRPASKPVLVMAVPTSTQSPSSTSSSSSSPSIVARDPAGSVINSDNGSSSSSGGGNSDNKTTGNAIDIQANGAIKRTQDRRKMLRSRVEINRARAAAVLLQSWQTPTVVATTTQTSNSGRGGGGGGGGSAISNGLVLTKKERLQDVEEDDDADDDFEERKSQAARHADEAKDQNHYFSVSMVRECYSVVDKCAKSETKKKKKKKKEEGAAADEPSTVPAAAIPRGTSGALFGAISTTAAAASAVGGGGGGGGRGGGGGGIVGGATPDRPVGTVIQGRGAYDYVVVATRQQFPLRLAWVMTIHKSQGMTICPLEIELASVFTANQSYVALSRASTLEGLRVIDYNRRTSFKACPYHLEFEYKYLNGPPPPPPKPAPVPYVPSSTYAGGKYATGGASSMFAPGGMFAPPTFSRTKTSSSSSSVPSSSSSSSSSSVSSSSSSSSSRRIASSSVSFAHNNNIMKKILNIPSARSVAPLFPATRAYPPTTPR